MINLIIGILLAKQIVTEDEAEYLVKEFESGVTPADFRLASRQIQTVFDNWGRKQAKKSAKNAIANNKSV